jgi:hypothetical protein
MEATMNKTLISVLELRRLMVELADKRPDIGIRFRLLGELWNVYSLRILRVTGKGALFFDESNNLVSISDLNFVMQFEIDRRFQGFQPFYHYEVTPIFEA